MAEWRAIALGSVRRDEIRHALKQSGYEWDEVRHVTATNSLAQQIRSDGDHALTVATLIDLLVMPNHPADFAVPLDDFPHRSMFGVGREDYLRSLQRWHWRASGRRLRIGIEMDAALRSFVRTAGSSPVGRVLVEARREVSRTILSLVSAGLSPEDIVSADPAATLMAEAWSKIEQEVPAVTTARRALWFDWHDGGRRVDDTMRSAFREALQAAFGDPSHGDRWLLIHHGFYFFTPPQWRLFRLLDWLDLADQVFVVHDDGVNPALKTWRVFFQENAWDMPIPEFHPSREAHTSAATAYINGISAKKIESREFEGQLRLLQCHNSVDFVRDWRKSRTDPGSEEGTRYFAPESHVLTRLLNRLDRGRNPGPVNLAQLPVGVFLLAVHDCIDVGSAATPRVRLKPQALLDMAASGFLDVDSANSSPILSALKRSLPFFRGCEYGDQWLERATALHRLIVDEVASLGGRHEMDVDRARIAKAVNNPLRLVPWADLSPTEAETICAIVRKAVEVVQETATVESKAIDGHLASMRKRLETGLRKLPEAEARHIGEMLAGFSGISETKIDAEGLVDIVRMILTREAEVDPVDETLETSGAVQDIRALDALGYTRSTRNIHVANLVDGVYPRRVPAIGWPLRLSDLQPPPDSPQQVSIEIMRARSESAGQSDLYLLWLALDGVAPDKCNITLSWIVDAGDEPRNPSSLLALLLKHHGVKEPVLRWIGGIPASQASLTPMEMGEPPHIPSPLGRDAPAYSTDSLKALDARATASALACQRRFALQWLVGDSASFRAEHLQAILYGNVRGSLVDYGGMSWVAAKRLCDDLWRHLTWGERLSSWQKRRVRRRMAKAEWTLFLAGSKKGKGPIDLAYKSAIAPTPRPLPSVTGGPKFLPKGAPNVKVCRPCPVRDRCLTAVYENER